MSSGADHQGRLEGALPDLEIEPEKYPLTIQGFTACALEFQGARHDTRWR